MPADAVGAYLSAARTAALNSAKILKARSDDLLNVRAQAHRDVKLSADIESEMVILELAKSTGISCLSEEAGDIGANNDDGLRWIIDPLDGTANYSRGIPFCCISIALEQDGEPVAGVVYDFQRDEMFCGAAGWGASLNGNPISVSRTAAVGQAILATGLPAGGDFSPEGLARFGGSLQPWHKVRLLGSAALSLAYVATGRCDMYYERAIKYWDVAAGVAIVRAAGGEVALQDLGEGRSFRVVASNAALFAEGSLALQ